MAVNDDALRLQADLERRLDAILDAQTRDLVKAWAIAWDEISGDLVDAIETLLDAYNTDELITAAAAARSEKLAAVLVFIGEQLTALAAQAGVRITRDVSAVIQAAGASQADIIRAMLPADAAGMVPDRWSAAVAPVEAMVRRVTEQITALHYPLAPDAYDVVRRELIRSIAVGENPRVTARRMVGRAGQGFNGGLTRALVISRTELVDAHREAAEYAQNLHADVLTGWIWLATLTSRTCRSCLAMHGEEFPLTQLGPDDHQQGRCVRMPKTRTWADLGFDVEEPPSTVPDAEAFFDGLTPREQQRILGRDGYQAWLDGDFPREAWSELRRTPGWRRSYVPAKAPKPAT